MRRFRCKYYRQNAKLHFYGLRVGFCFHIFSDPNPSNESKSGFG